MNAFKALFDTNGVKFIIYIDGLAHPVKATEDAQRSSIREAAKIEFQSLARSGDPNMIESMEKAMSKVCFVREDLIFNLKGGVIPMASALLDHHSSAIFN